ncbi:hypothetical protein PB01_14245 [Psychrobacillus glaciei]|uniref:Uncharacterized protein n=1 Tax=Psychrobacillus glaciei TaxID=2283160 RepID=A0A5J6SQF9_9BACI|nr:hypothetical protein [Psychrobacillus glaciei]QFF99889.1 hypothetical protein PB01_14245 [Psychrobacillus glaciei]
MFMAFGDKKDKEVLYKMIVLFIIGIGSTTLLYEFVKPSYTYAEAKAMVEQRYEIEVIDSHFTTTIEIDPDTNTDTEVYHMTAIEDSKKIKLMFNPYTMEITFLK